MTGNISFYGKSNETTGSVGDKQIDSTLSETTGSVGYRSFGYDSVPKIDRTLARDTVSFHGNSDYKEQDSSPVTTVLGVAGMAALAVAGLGYAHKTNAVSKISNEKIRNFLKNSDKITEPCYKLCCKVKSLSKNCYDKIVNLISKKK